MPGGIELQSLEGVDHAHHALQWLLAAVVVALGAQAVVGLDDVVALAVVDDAARLQALQAVELVVAHCAYALGRRRAGDALGIAALAVPAIEPLLGRDERGQHYALVVDGKVGLPHEVVAHVLLAPVGVHAHAAHVGCGHFPAVIEQGIGQGLQGGHHVPSYLAGIVVLALVHTPEVQLDEGLGVVEHELPQCTRLLVDALLVLKVGQRALLGEGVFLEQQVGLVRQFRLAQALFAHVFLAVDIGVLLGQVAHKLLVDDGECSLVAGVGLLHTHVEGAVVYRAPEGEGYQFAVDPNGASGEL